MKLSEVVHRLPETKCPQCGYKLDAASVLAGEDEDRPPQSGDATVCMKCTTWLIYTDTLGVRLMTAEEIADLDVETRRTLKDATRAINRVNKMVPP
jgi:hypothetical protein